MKVVVKLFDNTETRFIEMKLDLGLENDPKQAIILAIEMLMEKAKNEGLDGNFKKKLL